MVKTTQIPWKIHLLHPPLHQLSLLIRMYLSKSKLSKTHSIIHRININRCLLWLNIAPLQLWLITHKKQQEKKIWKPKSFIKLLKSINKSHKCTKINIISNPIVNYHLKMWLITSKRLYRVRKFHQEFIIQILLSKLSIKPKRALQIYLLICIRELSHKISKIHHNHTHSRIWTKMRFHRDNFQRYHYKKVIHRTCKVT